MAVLLVGIYSEGSVWLVREVRRVLRLLGVGSKTKNWVDCNKWSSAIHNPLSHRSSTVDPSPPLWSIRKLH